MTLNRCAREAGAALNLVARLAMAANIPIHTKNGIRHVDDDHVGTIVGLVAQWRNRVKPWSCR